MQIGFGHEIGRFVVDIDGCLRSTNAARINAEALIALHGALDPGATIVWEINGESIPLSRFDQVELNEDVVGFFRSCAGPRLFRTGLQATRAEMIARPGRWTGAIAA